MYMKTAGVLEMVHTCVEGSRTGVHDGKDRCVGKERGTKNKIRE